MRLKFPTCLESLETSIKHSSTNSCSGPGRCYFIPNVKVTHRWCYCDHLAGIHRWRVRAGKVPGTKRWDTVGVHARSQVNRSQQCDKNNSIEQSFSQHSECLSKAPTTQHDGYFMTMHIKHRKIVAYEKNVYTYLKSI